jgi:hypothetical protein
MADGRIDYHGFRYEGLTGMHVLSSVDVPSQVRACSLPTLRFLLGVAFRQRTRGGRSLPVELADIIVGTALAGGGLGITREEAEIRRRALMADRRVGGVGVNKVRDSPRTRCSVHMLISGHLHRSGRRDSRCASIEPLPSMGPSRGSNCSHRNVGAVTLCPRDPTE